MIGSTIGNYQVVRKLGEGGMGTVYAAIDLMLEREVALKVLRPELAGQPEIAGRFRAEAVTLARLQHPHIATLYSLAREGGELMMVMELVDGDTLERILQRTGPIPAGTAVRWCREVLEAMSYAHRKGVVHRDIKPANVMITTDGSVKVTDFGIAHVLGGTRLTRTGHIIGTAAYMAPEQIRGREVDARTDIYALASVLFELLTGRPPFEAEDEFALMTAQVTEGPPSARAAGAQVPEWLDEAILRGLAKAPGARFQTATAFGEALADGLRESSLPEAEPAAFLPAEPRAAEPGPQAGSPPPTRLASTPSPAPPGLAAPAPPPTRLAAPRVSTGWGAPRASSSPVAGGPVPGRHSAAARPRLNWRHYAGASAVLLLLVAVAAAWLGPSRRKPAVETAPAPVARDAVPAAPTPPPPATPPVSTPAAAAPTELARVEPPERAAPEVPVARQVPPVRRPAPQRKPVASTPPAERPGEAAPRQPRVPVPSDPGTPPGTEPVPSPKPPAAPRAKQEPETAAPAGTPASMPDATYRNVQWTVAQGDESDLAKIVMEFREAGLTLRPTDSDLPALTIPYAAIAGATYSQTRPSRLKRLLLLRRRDQHWLELRTKDGQALLRLESNNYRSIVAEVEKRTGLRVVQ